MWVESFDMLVKVAFKLLFSAFCKLLLLAIQMATFSCVFRFEEQFFSQTSIVIEHLKGKKHCWQTNFTDLLRLTGLQPLISKGAKVIHGQTNQWDIKAFIFEGVPLAWKRLLYTKVVLLRIFFLVWTRCHPQYRIGSTHLAPKSHLVSGKEVVFF